jgi:CP family cyanate transporter-like MFS transporter
MTSSEDRAALVRQTGRALLVCGLLLVSFNLRPALTSLSPLLDVVREELGLSHTVMGALTLLPILCFGIFPLAAMRLADRIGMTRGLLVAVAITGVAVALRAGLESGGGQVPLLFGTVLLAGIGIAIAQTLLPVLIKQHFPDRAVLVMGLYSIMMTVGAGTSAGLTAPLMNHFGSWSAALAIWALPALLAFIVWLPIARRQDTTHAARPGGLKLPWRSGLAWHITLVSGAVFSLFWSVLTWLAPAYQAQGISVEGAGALLALVTGTQVVSTLIISALANRSADRRPWFALCLITAAVGFVGIAFHPAIVPPWVLALLIGVGIGAIFPLALLLPFDAATDVETTGRLSAMALSVGYLFAALGPFVMGWLRGLTGDYTVPFLALAVLAIGTLLAILGLRPGKTVES